MYIFVFLWTPILMPSDPPFGMVFACFMVTIMIGSSSYTLMLGRGMKAESTLRVALIIIAVSMGICCFTGGPNRDINDMKIIYGAFLALEIAIGMYIQPRPRT
jgi:hypothetical protein